MSMLPQGTTYGWGQGVGVPKPVFKTQPAAQKPTQLSAIYNQEHQQPTYQTPQGTYSSSQYHGQGNQAPANQPQYAPQFPQSFSSPPPAMGQTPSSGNMNVTSSIAPGGVYSNDLTNQTKNQAVADAFANNSPFMAQKAFQRPGFSSGAGTDRLAAPTIANGYTQAASAASTIPFNDQMTNMNFDMRGQQARDQEGLGWAQMGNQMNNFNQQQSLNDKRSATSLLSQIMGGY